MERVLHEEFGPLLAWSARILIVGSLAFAVFEGVQGFPNDALGLLVGILGPIIGLTVWGMHRHSMILLTTAVLEVGRERLELSALDAFYGVRDLEDLDASERFRVLLPIPIPESASIRIPGGAWGKIAGTEVVVVRSPDEDKKLAFFTRRPEVLVPLLRNALGAAVDAREVTS